MAAADTVLQLAASLNPHPPPTRPLTPAQGVVTLFGYGLSVRIDRGHLIVEDGIGATRRRARFARVGHGLHRVVVIGADGVVSLAALRWLTDQKIAFVMLDRTGTVLVATGPTGPRDARLRRAQALAMHSGAALAISKDLILRKLREQARVAREVLGNVVVADTIGGLGDGLKNANTVDELRVMEAHAAAMYWRSWRAVPVMFPKVELARVPEHWRSFGTRLSPLTSSPRLSVNPPNAMLNYLYALVESEARLAAAAMGLDPGLGVMHADTRARDNLAADLMEPVRPLVDAFVLDWILQQTLRREWFFEERNGNCRLMATFAERLSRTAPTWAQAVAPIAERVAKALWSADRKSRRDQAPATRLTQQHRRDVKGGVAPAPKKPERPPRVCRVCGTAMPNGDQYCAACWATHGKTRLPALAVRGRVASHSPQAEARRAASHRANAKAAASWDPSSQPAWLTQQVFDERVRPLLARVMAMAVTKTTGLSRPYAARVRDGRVCPHPRHWLALARLVGITD